MGIKLIMFLCRIYYKKYGKAIFYINGTGKDFPRYLLYTETDSVRNAMEKI